MDPLTITALVSGGAALLNFFGQRSANKQQQNFAENQSTTAYQRAVQDMQRAGLNPMLAYSQGGATSMGISPQNPLSGTAAGISSAAQNYLGNKETKTTISNLEKQGKILDQNRRTAKATADQADIDTINKALTGPLPAQTAKATLDNIIAQGMNIRADTTAKQANARLAEVNARLGRANATGAEWESEKTKQVKSFFDLFGQKGGQWWKLLPSMIQPNSARGLGAVMNAATAALE